MAEIIPGILAQSFDELSEMVGRVARYAPRVQIDVVDGKFAPARTWPFVNDRGEFKKLISESEGLPFWEQVTYEIDMMVANPAALFDDWVSAGASSLIIHRESVNDEELNSLIEKGTEKDIEIGLALRPSTPNETVLSFAERVSFIQCMGNDKIGYHGVELDPTLYDKIRDIHTRWPTGTISVDIGVTKETAPALIRAGATKLVSWSALFENDNPGEMIGWFKKL